MKEDGLLNLDLWEQRKLGVLAGTWVCTAAGTVEGLPFNPDWRQLAEAPIYVGYGDLFALSTIAHCYG